MANGNYPSRGAFIGNLPADPGVLLFCKENTMPECAACIELNEASAMTSPHANLLLHSQAGINFGGTATGHVEYYVCNVCGTKWERSVARSEPDARWQHTSKQLD